MSLRFPTEPAPLPTELGLYEVVEITRVPARTGELPNLAVAIVRDTMRPEGRNYGTCDASYRDDKWHGFSGHYDLSLDDATEEHDRRVARRVPGESV